MFDERILADLDVLDHLQIYGSTVKVADLLGLSQSSCSRRYRLLNEQLGLAFDRCDSGYVPRANADVLRTLREVSQKLRSGRAALRCSASWQSPPLVWPQPFLPLEIPSMNTGAVFAHLENRLLDVWFGGLFECQPLIAAPLQLLQGRRLALGSSLVAIPLLRWSYVLVSHRSHPLQGCSALGRVDLAAYPSLGLPADAAPMLSQALRAHGLGRTAFRGPAYDHQLWEGAARDGHTLVVVPPHRLADLEAEGDLLPLPYDLGIEEVMAVVGHRDVLGDPSFSRCLKGLRDAIGQSALGRCPEVRWLA